MSFKFRFEFQPVPKGRPRTNRKTGRIYTPRTTQEFEENVREYASLIWRKEAMKGRLMLKIHFADDYFDVEITSLEEKKHHLRGDLDNLGKAVMDALQGIIFENDNQFDVIILTR